MIDALELLQPGRLLWLLALPVLYWLSRPPRPRRVRASAHLAQWLAAQRRLRRRPVRFRWLRFLLLAAAFLAVVLAHGEPRLAGTAGATDLVVLVDASASMAAENAAAWRAAVAHVGEVLAAVPPHVDVRLGLCSATVRVVRGSRPELAAVLAGTQPAAAGRVDLAAMAASLARPHTAVLTVTDGLGPTAIPTEGALTIVGRGADNLAITACAVVDSWPLPDVAVSVTVANLGAAPQSTTLTCSGGIAPAEPVAVNLAAGGTTTVPLRWRRQAGGPVRIALPAGDALALDDAVVVGLPAPPRPDIVVRSEGPAHPALLAAARALAGEVGGKVVTEDAAKAGFVLMSGGSLPDPAAAAGARMLTLGTALGPGPAPVRKLPKVLSWDREDPLLAGLDLSDLQVESAIGLPPSGGKVLVAGDGGPLVVVREGDGAAAVHLAFALGESNLFKLSAFPQFLRRSFARSYGDRATAMVAPDALLDAAESALARTAAAADRPLPPFAEPARGLAVPLLLLGLLLLAARAYA